MGLIVGLSLSPLAANLLHSPSSRLRTPFRFKGRHQTGVRESTKSNSDLDNPLLPIILFFSFFFYQIARGIWVSWARLNGGPTPNSPSERLLIGERLEKYKMLRSRGSPLPTTSIPFTFFFVYIISPPPGPQVDGQLSLPVPPAHQPFPASRSVCASPDVIQCGGLTAPNR